MSEGMQDAPPPRGGGQSSGGGGGIKGAFTGKIGPLPMWAWVAIIGGGIVAWSWWSNRQAASSSTSTTATDSTSADTVPQFVNQTYVTTTAPTQGPPGPAGKTGATGKTGVTTKSDLTRTWTSLGGSTYGEVAQRLLGNTDVGNLKPADARAQKWVENVYERNHNAKMPKGLKFTYQEGTVTPKRT